MEINANATTENAATEFTKFYGAAQWQQVQQWLGVDLLQSSFFEDRIHCPPAPPLYRQSANLQKSL